MTDVMEQLLRPLAIFLMYSWDPSSPGLLLHRARVGATRLCRSNWAVSSTAPTWRDASVALWVLSGLYLVLVALAAYGLGGYVAGRLRGRLVTANADEVEFRDGIHGVLVWALATLLTAALLLMSASAATRLTAPSGGAMGPATSVAGENIIAFDIDRLFRGDKCVHTRRSRAHLTDCFGPLRRYN